MDFCYLTHVGNFLQLSIIISDQILILPRHLLWTAPRPFCHIFYTWRIESKEQKLLQDKRPFTNYVDKFLSFFDHLAPSVDIFYLTYMVDTKSKYLTTYPHPLVDVVCERPLKTMVAITYNRA